MFPANDTLGSLVDDIILSLAGHTAVADEVFTLAASMSTSDTTFTAEGPTDSQLSRTISRGIVEIDTELIFVTSATGGVCQVAPWGRGYRNSGAEEHDAGAAIHVAPAFPRSVVARAVNDAILALYPRLYVPASLEVIADTQTLEIELPATAVGVLGVEIRFTETEDWIPVTCWDFTADGNVVVPATAPIEVRVWYSTRPATMASLSATWASTGMPESYQSIVRLNACADLLPWLDAARIPVQAASVMDSAQIQVGVGASLGQALRQRADARIAEERRVLDARFPRRIHRIR